jgi:hypothetical protein
MLVLSEDRSHFVLRSSFSPEEFASIFASELIDNIFVLFYLLLVLSLFVFVFFLIILLVILQLCVFLLDRV